jgi:hypothetical protein
MMRLLALLLLFPATVAAQDFTYNPPGDLVPGSGSGRADDMVYVPDMRFPIEVAPAYPNSQVWGRGGSQGGGGGQCDTENYSYPWWDNYCESRSWTMPLCPSGTGHQGQDIRPSTCDKSTHWVVAAEDGQITDIGTYAVWHVSDGGTQHRYLHMDMARLEVAAGQRVAKGDRLGLVSNDFGGTPTTIHLHYDINQNIPAAGGNVYVPTYMSLVRSYESLIGMEAEPCAVIPAAGGTVDDAGPCATFFGNPDFWRVVTTGGNDGGYHWTNGFVSDNPSNWARWTLHFEEAGRYNVEFNVVPPHNVSKKARYMVRANGEEATQEVDQSSIDEWFSLGEFQFAAGADQKVELYDNTGDTADDQHITADAIRLTRVDGPGGNNGTNGGNNGTSGTNGGNNGTSGGSNNGTTDIDLPVWDVDDVRVKRGCCSTIPGPQGTGWLFALIALVLVRRRR